ncbi:MAG: hypothetical protein ACRDJL_11060 [Actinomycetota bacterium]
MEDDLEQGLEWEDDDPEADEAFTEWERVRTEALQRLRESLVHLRGEPPPAEEVEAAAIALRANLASEDYPFPQLARALAAGGGRHVDDPELLVRAVAATLAPPQTFAEVPRMDEEIAYNEIGVHADLEEEGPSLDMDTDDLDVDDWLALVSAAVMGPDPWVDPEQVVARAGLNPDSEEAWIKEGALSRALSLWEDLGMLDRGRVTSVGKWVLPRAVARELEGDFDQLSD